MKIIEKLICLIIVLFLVSCEKNINTEDISKLLKISNDEFPVIAEGYSFRIDNYSEYCIQFPLGYNLQIFVDTIDGIKEISNSAQYFGEAPITIEEKGSPQSSIFISFSPRTQDLSLLKSMDFYVVISGSLCDDSSVIIEKTVPFEVNQ